MSKELSRLESVELREIWKNEASDFTPWLAEEGNLEILADTLGFELEPVGQEVNVGPFRADILCKNTVDKTWVVIENQLEKTDHWHLGQILTYSAGLDAHTIVWIAREFQDEHRAALDRLNEITQEEFQFFGIEIKLWRIGDSSSAPQFHIVSSPNNWSRNMKRNVTDGSSKTSQQFTYWIQFGEYMDKIGSQIKLPEPKADRNFEIRIGTSYSPIRVWTYKNEAI